jgi:hypothetical protein
MVAAPTPTQLRSETRVFRVEELIVHARAGRIRVPPLQHGIHWEREDVQRLIDSVWRGYPIGSLLLWRRPAPAGRVTLGDIELDVGEDPAAWFVIDGQQRIVSLVSTLLPGGKSDKFDLYFDLDAGAVVPPPLAGAGPKHLPLDRVLDPVQLFAWISERRASLVPEQVDLAIRVGMALRDYELPASVIDVDDEAVVREIFQRANGTGKVLDVDEVFGGLRASRAHPTRSLKEVVDYLRARSLGELDEAWILRSALALEQREPTREPQPRPTGAELPAALVERVARALDRVLGFLAQDAGIPHLRLLPYQSPLIVLCAYFDRFATPSARARRLLKRWLWRDAAFPEGKHHAIRAVQQRIEEERAALAAVHGNRSDEAAAQAVLATVPPRRPERTAPQRFNLEDARSRLSVIALAELRPHDLRSGAPLNVAELLESGSEPAPEILSHQALPSAAGRSFDRGWVIASVGNRLLHPSVADASMLPTLLRAIPPSLGASGSTHVLASHAIGADAIRALQEGDALRFLELRCEEIEAATDRLIDRHAEWNHSDRPSIASLIAEED